MTRLLCVLTMLTLLVGCATTEAEKQLELRELFKKADLQERDRDYSGARSVYGEILEINPKHARARFRRGTNHAREKNWGDAIEDLTEAIELHRMYASAFYNRGECYRGMWNEDLAARQNLTKAMDDYRRAIEVDRNHPKAHKKLAFLLALYPEKRQKHQAIHHYRRHLKIVRMDAQAERWLDKLLREYGDPREEEKAREGKQADQKSPKKAK